ncbi:MAG: DUF998 domain-containing protein [Candidatus Bathyarchaeia archaeon]
MLDSGKAGNLRRAGLTGILAPILAFSCILLSIASYPNFSWTNNALSDLGVVTGITGPLFNFGIYTSGLLALNFALAGLFTYLKKSLVGKVGALTFAAATVALIGIGVFNESFSGTHYAFSVAFFVLAPISLFIIACAFVLENQVRLSVFTVLTGIIAALPWILFFAINYVEGVAIPETVSGLAVSVWAITLGYRIMKHAKR